MTCKNSVVMWFLSGSEDKASSRLHGYLIHRELVRRGFVSKLVFAPGRHDVGDFEWFFYFPMRLDLTGVVSVIQKLDGPNTDRLIGWLQSCGSSVVYVGCDIRPGQNSWSRSDCLLVTSPMLREHYARLSVLPISIIREPYDFNSPPRCVSSSFSGKVLKVAWFGNKGNWGTLARWRKLIEAEYSQRLQLVTCSNHPDADIPWSLDNLRSLLLSSDFAVLPTEQASIYEAKSPNRLIQCLAVGLPTVAGPLAAYQELQAAGAPVLIAEGDQEFRQCIDILLSPVRRMEIAWASYRLVVDDYAVGSVADEWVELLSLERRSGFKLSWLRIRLLIVSVWFEWSRFFVRYSPRALAWVRRLSKLFDKQC